MAHTYNDGDGGRSRDAYRHSSSVSHTSATRSQDYDVPKIEEDSRDASRRLHGVGAETSLGEDITPASASAHTRYSSSVASGAPTQHPAPTESSTTSGEFDATALRNEVLKARKKVEALRAREVALSEQLSSSPGVTTTSHEPNTVSEKGKALAEEIGGKHLSLNT